MNEVVSDHLTYTIIGYVLDAHNQVGGEFQKVIFQRYLPLEMNKQEAAHFPLDKASI